MIGKFVTGGLGSAAAVRFSHLRPLVCAFHGVSRGSVLEKAENVRSARRFQN